ncbi:hypothetical protein F4677DRAFT_442094 [Hypoxylon crocopeplum]|nr:hypothetical protein F4677DRAFT_442094 [Hypoxylon crocopeplum]
MPSDRVCRDGFEFAYDRFLALPGRVGRVEPSALREMFLPKLTQAANKVLRDKYHFVQAQLKHYGVEYDEMELTGNGTNLLKKMLKAGKLDKVPGEIEKLRAELSDEWHNQLTMEELVETAPEWLLKKHFLDLSGQPNRSKTTEVLVLPLPPGSTYRAGKVIDLLNGVNGLHNERHGDALYVGWDLVKVKGAAEGHFERLQRQKQKKQEARDQERQAIHSEYLRRAQLASREKSWSPVGSYIIDCNVIEEQWPSSAEDMTLDLHETGEQGIFEAHFEFGVVEGMMILCTRKSALDQYCAQLDREAERLDYGYSEDDSQDDSQNDEDSQALSSKRPAKRGRGRPPKKARSQGSGSKIYFLQLKGRETGEGEILTTAEEGTIKFKDSKFASFTGEVDIAFIGRDVSFSARKVSDIPRHGGESWSDYSEAAYERARQSRW